MDRDARAGAQRDREHDRVDQDGGSHREHTGAHPRRAELLHPGGPKARWRAPVTVGVAGAGVQGMGGDEEPRERQGHEHLPGGHDRPHLEERSQHQRARQGHERPAVPMKDGPEGHTEQAQHDEHPAQIGFGALARDSRQHTDEQRRHGAVQRAEPREEDPAPVHQAQRSRRGRGGVSWRRRDREHQPCRHSDGSAPPRSAVGSRPRRTVTHPIRSRGPERCPKRVPVATPLRKARAPRAPAGGVAETPAALRPPGAGGKIPEPWLENRCPWRTAPCARC